MFRGETRYINNSRRCQLWPSLDRRDSVVNKVDVRSNHIERNWTQGIFRCASAESGRRGAAPRCAGPGRTEPGWAGLTRRHWGIICKARAERWSPCKLAPDLEPSPFYAAPSRPCSMDADVRKYNIFRAACESVVLRSSFAEREPQPTRKSHLRPAPRGRSAIVLRIFRLPNS